jgi:hypothetical protein
MALTVLEWSNIAFVGDFTPVLAKHSKSFSLIDCIGWAWIEYSAPSSPSEKLLWRAN